MNYEDADEDAARTLSVRLNDARLHEPPEIGRRVRRHAGFDVDDLVLVREVHLRPEARMQF